MSMIYILCYILRECRHVRKFGLSSEKAFERYTDPIITSVKSQNYHTSSAPPYGTRPASQERRRKTMKQYSDRVFRVMTSCDFLRLVLATKAEVGGGGVPPTLWCRNSRRPLRRFLVLVESALIRINLTTVQTSKRVCRWPLLFLTAWNVPPADLWTYRGDAADYNWRTDANTTCHWRAAVTKLAAPNIGEPINANSIG
jgi:hypothetical protein